MQLSDLLIAANIVTNEEMSVALALQQERGGPLGPNLLQALPQKAAMLQQFMALIPPEPRDVRDTGIHPTELLALLIKQIYSARLESNLQFIDAMKLPPNIVDELVRMAVSRNMLVAMGSSGGGIMRYELSEQGRRWAVEAMKTSQYTGPAPVTLEEFCARVRLQKITNDSVTFDTIRLALAGYDVTDAFIRKIGPALNSGRPLLMYGPPGNGKTTVALSFAQVFNAVVYLPYAVVIENQIMRVFDTSLHQPLPTAPQTGVTSLRREGIDDRWVAMRRPFVVTGGELNLEMLDLSYDQTTGFYEAPLHLKALGGCFVIDDFGRQLVPPAVLLNRWIVPMESRIDFLKLHTGKSFSIPFEAMVIFSTNLDPSDLMDGAFLRRLPYKIEVGAPSRETYKGIFKSICAKASIEFNDDIFEVIYYKVTVERRLELAAYHGRFIVDQVISIARFMGVPPRFTVAALDYALDNMTGKPKPVEQVT
jgi:DNA polymerase III delta prime subunit